MRASAAARAQLIKVMQGEVPNYVVVEVGKRESAACRCSAAIGCVRPTAAASTPGSASSARRSARWRERQGFARRPCAAGREMPIAAADAHAARLPAS
jgi:hypothetical protein